MHAATMMNRKPIAAYAKVAIDNSVEIADPHKLVLMLFDGAMLAQSSAQMQMENGKVAERGASISRAIDIISCGLKASLDMKQGGDLADKLAALYDYMSLQLIQANLNNNPRIIKEIVGLLGELRAAWAEIANDPAALSGNARVA